MVLRDALITLVENYLIDRGEAIEEMARILTSGELNAKEGAPTRGA